MKAADTARHTEVREPLIRIVKRGTVSKRWPYLVRLYAILAALVVCAILSVIVTGDNPIFLMGSMFRASFLSLRRILNLFRDTAILLCIALAVTPAFKMRFWNIGAEGQVLAGGLAAAACMICLGHWPPAVLLPVTLILAILAGAIWGVIPAIFKAFWGTNETLFTLMMNYIVMQIIGVCTFFWENPAGSSQIGVIKTGQLPVLFGQAQLLPILIVAAVLALVYVYLKYSKHGYEIEVVGQSENTARYIGVNVKWVIIRTMLVSGAVCGLVGFLLVSGVHHTLNPDTAGGQGFTAIMVSWLAKFNPIYMVLTALLLVFLGNGGSQIASDFRLNDSFSEILTGVILFFIIGCEFFIRYSIKLRHKKAEKTEREEAAE